jgi:hypothetical protein
MNFEELKGYLEKEECVASNYDDKSFTVLEFGTWENKLENIGIKEDKIPMAGKVKIVNRLQNKFKFAVVEMSDKFDVGFDFTLLKEDKNLNLEYILNAIHSFHDSFQREVEQYVNNMSTRVTITFDVPTDKYKDYEECFSDFDSNLQYIGIHDVDVREQGNSKGYELQ